MKKILVVEDDNLNREMLTRRLQKQGFSVYSAKDGSEALSLALEHIPDIMLMDLSLPDINGLEVVKRLKILPRTENIPIIILTGNTSSGIRDLCLASGATDYETKPVILENLLSKIDLTIKK